MTDLDKDKPSESPKLSAKDNTGKSSGCDLSCKVGNACKSNSPVEPQSIEAVTPRESDETGNLTMTTPTREEPVRDAADTYGGWMIGLLWLIAIAGGTFAAQKWLDERDLSRQTVVENYTGGQSLLLKADILGHYAVSGYSNGQPIKFLVDTGATGISITENSARRLNLQRGRPSQADTANGIITVYSTTLPTLQIGPFKLTNVQATINPHMDGDVGLLGMSFLRHYELIQRDGELRINQP